MDLPPYVYGTQLIRVQITGEEALDRLSLQISKEPQFKRKINRVAYLGGRTKHKLAP